MRRRILAGGLLGLFLASAALISGAQEVIKLPPPQTDKPGKSVMQALQLRRSTRDYGTGEKFSLQLLSNLLWAAYGVNRPAEGPNGQPMRTAPSAVNWQNIDIYVTTPDGLFLYDALNHSLKVLSKEDVRSAAGNVQVQPFVKDVPVNLVYIADFDRARGLGGQGNVMDTAEIWSFAGAGAIAENVYLFCASEGLASVVRAFAADKDVIQKTFKLRPQQHYLLAQSVGYFKTPPAAAPAAEKK